jgi:hypothetical protein
MADDQALAPVVGDARGSSAHGAGSSGAPEQLPPFFTTVPAQRRQGDAALLAVALKVSVAGAFTAIARARTSESNVSPRINPVGG